MGSLPLSCVGAPPAHAGPLVRASSVLNSALEMAIEHIIDANEDLQMVARRYGFFDAESLWTHPDNAALAEMRDSHFVLAPGDAVTIPDLEPARRSLGTKTRHSFRVPRSDRKLKIRLLGLDGEPLEGSVELAGEELELDDGIVETPLELGDRELSLSFESQVHTLVVAGLDPVSTDRGLVARLAALGYDIDLDDLSEVTGPDRLAFVVQLFQHATELEISGEVDDTFRAALVEAFGS